ncbi:MAG: mucoidy inhibitor MuiA family protein [Deltaproteobacteria bacterium]|nr:mucoidy inhibitor MuiA family protein [Deltaproteobacteria bacterium]
MRRSISLAARLTLGALLALPCLALAATLPTSELETRISAVTVFADRAQVTRTAPLRLDAEVKEVVVRGLPGWIDPESVRAGLAPAAAGEILDVRVEKSFLVEATDASVKAAEESLREISDRLEDLQDEEAVLRAEIAQLEALRAFSNDKLPRDMATRDIEVKTYEATFDFLGSGLREARAALRKVGRQRRALEPELSARSLTLSELRSRTQLVQQSVHLQIRGKGKAELNLSYLTSGATWEPVGELRARAEGRAVSMLQAASVVQTTGEDWEGAKLTFSTQLPRETLVVPEVQALLLGDDGVGLGEAVNRATESFQKARSSYLLQNELANKANPEWRMQLEHQQQVEQRATAAFESLAARGTTAHFEALAQRTVRSDGKTVRVPIARASFDAGLKLVAVPEVSLNVIRTAALMNTSEQSILPGRTALYLDGAFVGTSELPFVAPRESFSTFLGIHEGVKLERTIDRERSSIDRGRRRTTVTASFLISAENLGLEAVRLEVGDRVPVPQNEDLELDDVEIPKGAARDADGVVKWVADLTPGSKTVWRIEYTLEYPNDFLARGRPAASHPAKQRMIYDQVQALESAL